VRSRSPARRAPTAGFRSGTLLLAIGLCSLAACGYHLRTWDLAGNLETARIAANLRNPLTEPLGRALESAGVSLVDTEAADLVIELLDDRAGRRNVAVTSQARVAEYEATLSVQYTVKDRAGKVLIQPTWLSASRVYRVDRGNPVASNQEQTLLEREMVEELVSQVIRGVNAAVVASRGAA
jgi:LPS-assembly lipoprotein